MSDLTVITSRVDERLPASSGCRGSRADPPPARARPGNRGVASAVPGDSAACAPSRPPCAAAEGAGRPAVHDELDSAAAGTSASSPAGSPSTLVRGASAVATIVSPGFAVSSA